MAPQGYRHSGPCESPSPSLAAHSCTALLCAAPGEATQKQCVAETRDQNLLFPGTWARKGLTGLRSSKTEEKATTTFAQLLAVVQEHLGSSLPFLVPPRHRCWEERAQPFLPREEPVLQGSPCCNKWNHKSPNAHTSWALLPSHSGAQLHPSQGTQGAALTPLVTLQCPTEGLENSWSHGVHPRAAGHTASAPDHSLQSTSDPEKQLGTARSPKAEVLPPEGRARDAREQESLASLLRLGISPHITPQRHTSVNSPPPDHKGNPVPLNGSLLSAQAPRSFKHSKKAQELPESWTQAQTGRTRETLCHSALVLR